MEDGVWIGGFDAPAEPHTCMDAIIEISNLCLTRLNTSSPGRPVGSDKFLSKYHMKENAFRSPGEAVISCGQAEVAEVIYREGEITIYANVEFEKEFKKAVRGVFKEKYQ